MILLWIACGTLTAGFVIVMIKLYLIKKDIKQLGESLDKITSTNTNAKLRTNTFDKDITALIEKINSLLNKNHRDILESIRSETELKQALTNISHDLRTPLTSAKGYLQMLMKDRLDEDDVSRYHAIIQGRLDVLTNLLNSLFEFSRIAEENTSVCRVNVCNVLRDVLSSNFSELENKGFGVDIFIPESPVYLYCDVNALIRIIQNLIQNACVHGKNHLWVRLYDGKIEIANNIEKPNEIDINRIFERFYTLDTSRNNKRTGLGLAIAKKLTERMDGSISVSMENDVFTILINFPKN